MKAQAAELCNGDNATLILWSRTQQIVSLSFAEAEMYALTTGIAEGMVTKQLLQELGHEVTLVNHVDSQSAKAWASRRGLGKHEARDAEIHVCARCGRKEAHESCIHQKETEQSRSDDNVSNIAHERLSDAGFETQRRRGENSLEAKLRRRSVAEVKEQREREVKTSVRSRQSVQASKESAENITSFEPKFSARVFITMSSEFALGDNTLEFSIYRFF